MNFFRKCKKIYDSSKKETLDPSPDEYGSAISEFVLLALPLFVPTLLFFLSLNNSMQSEMEASFLARQAVLAFTNSESEITAHAKVRILLNEFQKLHATKFGPSSRLDYSIKCEAIPCLTPGAEIELSISINSPSEGRVATASARGSVDKW